MPDPFIARYVQILTSKRAVREMDFSIRAVHPCAAESAASQNDVPSPFQVLRIVILTPDREANGRRTLPFPLPEKFIHFRWCDPRTALGTIVLSMFKRKSAGASKRSALNLAGLMTQAQVPTSVRSPSHEKSAVRSENGTVL